MQCAHSIHVLSGDYPAVYREIGKSLSGGYAVVYAAESEGANSSKAGEIFKRIKESGLVADLEGHIERGALAILDIGTIYSAKAARDGKRLLEKWKSAIAGASRQEFKGVVVIAGGTTVFSDTKSRGSLVPYEEAISGIVASVQQVRIVCCYPRDSIEDMRPRHLFPIINAHRCLVRSDWSSARWHRSDIFRIIRAGIDRVLGAETGSLVLQTMKLVYRIDEAAILANPQIFEDKLAKIVGEKAVDIALKSISSEMRKYIQESKVR